MRLVRFEKKSVASVGLIVLNTLCSPLDHTASPNPKLMKQNTTSPPKKKSIIDTWMPKVFEKDYLFTNYHFLDCLYIFGLSPPPSNSDK